MSENKWFAVDDNINQQEAHVRKSRATENAERYSDIDVELGTFISEMESASTSIPSLEDTVKNVTTDVENAPSPQKAMETLRYRNLYTAMKADYNLQSEIDYLTMRREQLNRVLNAQQTRGQISPHIDDILRTVNEKIIQNKDLQEQLPTISPEAFIGLHLKKLKDYKESLTKGRLAETPYFKKQSAVLTASLEKGQPVFVHGHFGSGKTEMALEVAHDYLIDLNVRQDFEQWSKEHPQATREEQKKRLYKIRDDYENSKDQDKQDATTAYLISGSKNTMVSDLYAHKTLTLEHLNGKEVLEHNAAIEDDLDKWKEENSELKNNNPEEYWHEYDLAAQRIADIYKEKNFAAGTAVKEVLNHITSAAIEGKPVIIDEVNAIPHEVLISLNHLLTRRAGDRVTLPGVEEPLTIKEGFSIIYTGNINQGITEQYIGREDMDPAHLSRMDLLAHDYLPQDTDGRLEKNAGNDAELFHLILASQIDASGNLNMPEGDMEKLWMFAQFARRTQEIFSGQKKGQFFGGGSSRGEELMLKKSVCSIRDIKRVLETYDAGRNGGTLSQALWEKFIAQATVPEDQALLYQEARNKGLFENSEGWQTLNYNTVAEITGTITEKDVHPEAFKSYKRKPTFMGAREVVALAYGIENVPGRTVFPNMITGEDTEGEVEKKQDLDEESIETLQNFMMHIHQQLDAIEIGKVRACADVT